MGQGLALCPCEQCLGCRAHPPSGFRWSKYDVIDPWKTKDLETENQDESPRHRYLLCSQSLHGLILKSRTWGKNLIGSLPRSDFSLTITLFLTTNRVGTFDDAFMSRIHVVIAYDDLGNTERKTIWKQFFEKLTKDRQDITITKRAKTYVLEDEDMVNVGWNGREIRNGKHFWLRLSIHSFTLSSGYLFKSGYLLTPLYLAFQTAVALADYRAQKDGKGKEPFLDQKDFEQVLNLSADFKEYLKRIDGADEGTRAFRAKNRALAAHDSFEGTR